jgi:glyoxylase-like metal-dependent hydrolase (beta-lactamase superfamily II)
MNQLSKLALGASLAAIALATSAFANNAFAKDEPTLSFKTTKITDTLYMLSGEGGFTGGNVGLTVGKDGVAMIDNGVSEVLTILKAEIAEITDKPIDYMINTHVHGDHIGNNHAFGDDGAQIVSHENLRASLIKKDAKEGTSSTRAQLPILTFNDRMTIHINGDAAKIVHFDNAHTDGDAVVHFENDNVLHTGDIMFNGMFPYIDGSNGGSLDGVISALEGIAKMANGETKIIPGHGPIASKADVIKTVAMLKDSRALVKAMVDAGKTDQEILEANPLSKHQSYNWAFITTEKMTQQVLAAFR